MNSCVQFITFSSGMPKKLKKQTNYLVHIIKCGIEIIIMKYDGYGVSSPEIPWMFGSRQTVIAKNMTKDIFFSILYYVSP